MSLVHFPLPMVVHCNYSSWSHVRKEPPPKTSSHPTRVIMSQAIRRHEKIHQESIKGCPEMPMKCWLKIPTKTLMHRKLLHKCEWMSRWIAWFWTKCQCINKKGILAANAISTDMWELQDARAWNTMTTRKTSCQSCREKEYGVSDWKL